MEIRKYVLAVAGTLASAACGAYLYSCVAARQGASVGSASYAVTDSGLAVQPVVMPGQAPTDFTAAAEHTVGGVVYVKVYTKQQGGYDDATSDLFDFFFGPRFGQRQSKPRETEPQYSGSGSGVIITADGYIVTNNHVVENADRVEIVLNDKRSFEGKVVGTDPTTDIAVVKIEASGLDPIAVGNSDALRVGEWVLAVGNPMNMTSTVTAGIVSAKGRNLGSERGQMSIESFIQTDAAINPGNSGGALVNVRGELVGINTAILSQSGMFAGMGFAVPSAIAMKVASDIMEYGEVQRALLGVTIRDVDTELATKHGLEKPQGVLVVDVTEGGAAREAGVRADDVILSVDGQRVSGVAELQGLVARKHPGDACKLGLVRGKEKMEIAVTLRNVRGTTTVVKNTSSDTLGAELEALGEKEADKLGLRGGVKVVSVGSGKLAQAGVKKGFIITKANRVPVTEPKELQQIVSQTTDGLFISGLYPNGQVAYYAIDTRE